MDYSVEYDESTGEYVATAGEDTYATDCAQLAYSWLAAQILAGES